MYPAVDEMLAECRKQGIPVTSSTTIEEGTAIILAELLRRTDPSKGDTSTKSQGDDQRQHGE